MKYQVLLLIILCKIGLLRAQNHTTFNYSLEEGLPSSEVYQVFQDKEGFIWFATDNGIVRYDGKEMQTFHVKDGLSDPVVFGFQEDDDGRVWLKSYSGKLSYLENGKIKRYKYNNKIAEVVKLGVPNTIYSAQKKELTLLSQKKLIHIDSIGNTAKENLKEDGIYYFGDFDAGIVGSTISQYDTFHIFVNNTKFKVEVSKKPFLLSSQGIASRSIQWRNKLYITIKNNIFCYDGKGMTGVYAGRAPIISLSKDKNDNLWIGYMSAGAEGFSKTNFKEPVESPFPQNLSVTGFLEDTENGYWISTLEQGVFYLPNNKIKNIYPVGKSKITQVSNLGDSIFSGNQKGEFTILHGTTGEVLWKISLNSPIHNFYLTQKRNLFLYTDKTHIYDSALQLKNKLKAPGMAYIEENNGDLWVYGNGTVGKFNKDGRQVSSKRIFTSYRSFTIHDSQFLMAGKTGLDIRNKNLELVLTPPILDSYKISSMISLNDSTVLINTLGSGLLLLNSKSWDYKKFDTENNFSANNIYTCVKRNNSLWLGTEAGVIRLDIASLLIGKLVYNRWDKRSGLIDDDIKFLAIVNQNIWAFSDNGYSIIPKNIFEEPQKNPIPYLKSIVLNDSVSSRSEKNQTINLPHDKTNIGIHVGYRSFKNQDIISRYRISKNAPWEYTKERSFQFTSLAPDNYAFELEYSIDNVNWIPAGIDFDFKVNPPWWREWYFLTGIVLISIFLILLYARFQIKNYQQKNHLLKLLNTEQQKLVHAEISITERERKRIAKELHDGVGTSLTAIKLGVMSQLAQQLNSDNKIQHFEDQFKTALKEIKDIAYELTPPDLERYGLFKAITSYVNKLTISIATDIQLNLYGSKIPEGELALSVFRILQELINNSLKHAKAEKIGITINTFDDLMSIIYEDNGIGFTPELVQKGLGLANIESRVQLLQGEIVFESTNPGVAYLIDIPINNEP